MPDTLRDQAHNIVALWRRRQQYTAVVYLLADPDLDLSTPAGVRKAAVAIDAIYAKETVSFGLKPISARCRQWTPEFKRALGRR